MFSLQLLRKSSLIQSLRSDVLVTMIMKIAIKCNVMLSSYVNSYQCFGETNRLHLHGKGVLS